MWLPQSSPGPSVQIKQGDGGPRPVAAVSKLAFFDPPKMCAIVCVKHIDNEYHHIPIWVGDEPAQVREGIDRVEFDGMKTDLFSAKVRANEQRGKFLEGIEAPFGNRREKRSGYRKRDRGHWSLVK